MGTFNGELHRQKPLDLTSLSVKKIQKSIFFPLWIVLKKNHSRAVYKTAAKRQARKPEVVQKRSGQKADNSQNYQDSPCPGTQPNVLQDIPSVPWHIGRSTIQSKKFLSLSGRPRGCPP